MQTLATYNFKGGVGRRLSDAYAGVFPRKTRLEEPVSRRAVKDSYVDPASGD